MLYMAMPLALGCLDERTNEWRHFGRFHLVGLWAMLVHLGKQIDMTYLVFGSWHESLRRRPKRCAFLKEAHSSIIALRVRSCLSTSP